MAGTAAAGTAGSYPITITASNGVGSPASQSFTLTVTTAASAPAITVADPGAELGWVASLPGSMSGEHRFKLTPADSGTRPEQSETFRGLLTAFSGKTFTNAEASFQALNEALKQRAESS
jgi:hypothetical protein